MSDKRSELKSVSPPIEVIEVDEIESSTKIEHRVCTKGESKKTKSDSGTETEDEDESEWKNSKRSRDDDDKDGGTGQINVSTERKSIELGEIRKFDVLIPTQRNCHGIQEGRKGFFLAFAKYRKLIDALRPVFMEHDTPEHKRRICKYVVDKIALVGGRFLQEDEDGTSSSCRVMSPEESMQCTTDFFQNNPSWTSIASLIQQSNGQSLQFAQSLLQTGPQGQKIKAPKSSPADIANSKLTSPTKSIEQAIGLNYKTADALGPPDLKKAKLSSEVAAVPPKNGSSTPERKQLDTLVQKTELYKLSSSMQTSLTERNVIRAELTENQQILMARQERVAHLEMQFRLFQDRRFFLSSERWLAEKVIREEEIMESRELLGIQLQRCRRLQSLLKINERQVIEQERVINWKEKELLQNSLNYKQDLTLLEMQQKIRREENNTKGIILGNMKAAKYLGTNNTATKKLLAEIEMKRQNEIPILSHNVALKPLVDENLAIQAELNRRMTLKQRAGAEEALEQTLAMEQEMQYRQAMDHAKWRQAIMQQSIEARKELVREEYLTQPSAETLAQEISKRSGSYRVIFKRPTIPKEASPNVSKSKNDTKKQKVTIVIDDDNDNGSPTEAKSNGDVAAPATSVAAATEEEEDDFIVI